MAGRKKNDPGRALIEAVAGALTDKKGVDPVILDFTGIKGALCDAFVICHGTSVTQVEALARHVDETVKKATGLNPSHAEGFENAEWILLDYFDVVVHIFQEERRRFYNLEQLWADAQLTRIEVQPPKPTTLRGTRQNGR